MPGPLVRVSQQEPGLSKLEETYSLTLHPGSLRSIEGSPRSTPATLVVAVAVVLDRPAVVLVNPDTEGPRTLHMQTSLER